MLLARLTQIIEFFRCMFSPRGTLADFGGNYFPAKDRSINRVVECPSTIGTIATRPPQDFTSFAPTTVSSL